MPQFVDFMKQFPSIALDIHYADRLVDIIEEGFDIVFRTGVLQDSQLTSRSIGAYQQVIVATPEYLKQRGHPQRPEDLMQHTCLRYRYPTTGKIAPWPLYQDQKLMPLALPESMVTNTLNPMVYFAEQGVGLACLPNVSIQHQLQAGLLVPVLAEFNQDHTPLQMLWPSNRHLSPKLRAFVDFMSRPEQHIAPL